MTPTEQNTLALIWNTYWLQISTGVTLIGLIIGIIWNKSRSKNIIQNTKNKKGKISQHASDNNDNIINNVDNENGYITQK